MVDLQAGADGGGDRPEVAFVGAHEEALEAQEALGDQDLSSRSRAGQAGARPARER
jgi:hypothetical protein